MSINDKELILLRYVYEDARRVLRNWGVDKERFNKAMDALDNSIVEVMEFDSGTYDE